MTLGGPAPGEDWEEAGAFTNMDAYWKSANELLHRIRRLETGQQGAACPTDTTRGQRDGGRWRESLGEAENHREFPPLAWAKQPGPRGGGRAGQGGDPPFSWRDSSPGTSLPQRSLTEDVYEEEERQNTRVRDGHAATYPVQVVCFYTHTFTFRTFGRRFFSNFPATYNKYICRGVNYRNSE